MYRAYSNGKATLSTVESLAGLIQATDESERYIHTASIANEVARNAKIRDWRNKILELCATLEIAIDFDETGTGEAEVEQIKAGCKHLALVVSEEIEKCKKSIENIGRSRAIIAGPPNVGKSTLMNFLVGEDVSIISEHEGTTRDIVRSDLVVAGHKVDILDTAGIRQTIDPVEKMGIEKSKGALSNEQSLVILVCEPSHLLVNPEGLLSNKPLIELKKTTFNFMDSISSKNRLLIVNKSDLLPSNLDNLPDTISGMPTLYTSFKEPSLPNRPALLATLGQHLINLDTPVALFASKRHLSCLEHLHHSLEAVVDAAVEVEVVGMYLQACRHAISDVDGYIDTESILASVFSRLCVGK